ncbi:hypothetical protein FX016_05385 [Cupriavidus gilardii]|nr:hypothetical protein FX016_05385 [Cupriavidus gilardii]
MSAKAAPPAAAIRRDPTEPEGKAGLLRQFMRDLRAARPTLTLHLDTTGVSLMSSAVQEVEPLFEATDAISPDLVEASQLLPAGDAVLGVVDLAGTAADKVKTWRRVCASEPGYRLAVASLARARLPEEIERRKAALKTTRHWIRACLATPARHDGAPAPILAAHRLRQDGAAHIPDTFRQALTAGNRDAAALGKAALGVIERELAAIDRERDAILRQHAADLLEHDAATRADRSATRRLCGSAVACLRDSGLQGLRVGYEASPLADSAWDAPLDLGLIPGDVFSFGLGAAIGLAHVGCGIGELAEARRRRGALREIGQAVGDNLRRLPAVPARSKRLQSPATSEALRWFADGQRRWRQRAGELTRWSVGRIAYGVGTVLLSGAGMAMVSILGTAVLATPVGAALVAIGGVLGGAWFLFTLIRIAMRFMRGRADTRERERLADAVRRGAARGLCADRLSQCSVAQLESLRRDCPALSGNRYWQAAMLTRRLLIDDAADKPAGKSAGKSADKTADKTAGKASRLETSALLQALGMPKLSTTLLKHAGFELAYRTIFLYLHGDGAQAAWREGIFHRAETADAPRSRAHGG